MKSLSLFIFFLFPLFIYSQSIVTCNIIQNPTTNELEGIAAGGVPPYSYQWFILSQVGSNSTIMPTANELYLLVVSDDNNNISDTCSFLVTNIPTGIVHENISQNKRKLLKVIDILGRETGLDYNEYLFYIYNDGTAERKLIID